MQRSAKKNAFNICCQPQYTPLPKPQPLPLSATNTTLNQASGVWPGAWHRCACVCVAQYMTNAGLTCWPAHSPFQWLCSEGRGGALEGGRAVTFCFVDFMRICLLDHRTTTTTAATATTKNKWVRLQSSAPDSKIPFSHCSISVTNV